MTDCSTTEREESPVPSMTLSITHSDAIRVVEAARALAKCVATLKHRERDQPPGSGEKKSLSSPTNSPSLEHEAVESRRDISTANPGSACSGDESSLKPSNAKESNTRLHEMLGEAAQLCKNPLISSFAQRMRAAGATRKEISAGILLFHDLGKTAKLKLFFDILADEKLTSQRPVRDIENNDEVNGSDKTDASQPQPTLNREGTLSLFRSVVMSISICLHAESTSNSRLEKPAKIRRQSMLSPASATVKSEDDVPVHDFPTCQSPSFDSSMGTLRDEEERELSGLPDKVREEVEDIASYAADRLVDFARKRIPKNSIAAITFDAFGDWYNFGGCAIVPWLELLDLSKWKPPSPSGPAARAPEKAVLPVIHEESPNQVVPSETALPKFYSVASPSTRTVVSFDFTGATGTNIKTEEDEPPFCINITEANLIILRDFVHRTGISSRAPADVCKSLLRYASKHTKLISRTAFQRFVGETLSEASVHLPPSDLERYKDYLEDFFTCFATVTEQPNDDEVNVKELAVGLSVLCCGNKSAKLAIGFELLDSNRCGSLTQGQLNQYIRSYLTMLVAISLLTSDPSDGGSPLKKQRAEMHDAVRNGARWTLGHFLKVSTSDRSCLATAQFSFENFAEWYTSGGYNVAPWLELLDLGKLLSLIVDEPSKPSGSLSGLRGSGRNFQERKPSGYPSPQTEVLFTFPLANHRSLVVLRDDATYVRSVVEKLGLLSLSAEDVWSTLSTKVWQGSKSRKSEDGLKSVVIDEPTFVRCMEEVVKTTSAGRKRKLTGGSKSQDSVRETLANFFQSFDLDQIGRVGLNELMGGLTLLCGGKKSTKLAFAFSVFDSNFETKGNGMKADGGASLHSLCGQEMFLFLRSFLIVMFSCCQQSLDLSADACNRYINDTANSVADDVMRFRNHSRKRDRVDFDDFGEWYNEGGFETAPWLELLDLKKWVLVDNFDALDTHVARAPVTSSNMPASSRMPPDQSCPPPPPEDAIDHSFFAEDYQGIMPIDSMDEMDIILMQQPSQDKENDSFPAGKITMSFSYSPDQRVPQSRDRNTNSLKFHVVTDDDHGGYMLSLSQKRIRHLRKVLVESGLHNIDAESACHKIISKASPGSQNSGARGGEAPLLLTKSDFDSAMRSIISGGMGKVNMSLETQRTLSDLLACIFTSFDREQTGLTNAMEVACGFTVLCRGKKSDKLEFAFEVLDNDKDGMLSKAGMGNYLRSFLTVLLSIAVTSALEFDSSEDSMTTMLGISCERTPSTVGRAVSGGAKWAANQALKSSGKAKGQSSDESTSFDDFAEWYTNVGYSCIPWLELLDLRKWVILDS